MPPVSRTGIQYSVKEIPCRGSRKPYVSWLRKRPACSSTYALSLSERVLRLSRPSGSTPHDQIFLAGTCRYSAKCAVPVLVWGFHTPMKSSRLPCRSEERRVGKECRSGVWGWQYRKKKYREMYRREQE